MIGHPEAGRIPGSLSFPISTVEVGEGPRALELGEGRVTA